MWLLLILECKFKRGLGVNDGFPCNGIEFNIIFCFVTDDIQQEVDHIFELAKSLNLLVLECDTINHPSQLQKSTLAPILVYLKIASAKVKYLVCSPHVTLHIRFSPSTELR